MAQFRFDPQTELILIVYIPSVFYKIKKPQIEMYMVLKRMIMKTTEDDEAMTSGWNFDNTIST